MPETPALDAPDLDATNAYVATDTPPSRLSTNSDSPHFDQSALERGIGIRFKGKQRFDVEEYDLSEGWIRVALGKKVDRRGRALTVKLAGDVEAWFERPADTDVE